jgi:hypothetical protein
MENNLLIVSTFNTQFIECLTEITDIYPDNLKFKKYKRYIGSVKRMNPSLLVKIWKKHVTDIYESKIEEGNFDYFLNKDYKEDLASIDKTESIEAVIDDIRAIMVGMTQQDRDNSFKYIRNLTRLSKHYV